MGATDARDSLSLGDLVAEITEAFTLGQFDLSQRSGAPAAGWDSLPECVAAAKLRSSGCTDAGVRIFLTLVAALDRAREANQLWEAATRLFQQATRVFNPAAVITRSFTSLRDELAAVGVSQRHGPQRRRLENPLRDTLRPGRATRGEQGHPRRRGGRGLARGGTPSDHGRRTATLPFSRRPEDFGHVDAHDGLPGCRQDLEPRLGAGRSRRSGEEGQRVLGRYRNRRPADRVGARHHTGCMGSACVPSRRSGAS